MTKNFYKSFILVLLLTFSQLSFSAVRIASNNGYWNQTSTWGGNPIPVIDDEIIINNGVTVTMTSDFENIARFELQGTGTIELSGYNLTTACLKSAGNSRIVNSSTLTDLTVNSSFNDTAYNGIIEGNIRLIKNGGYSLTLSGNNTYSGTTIVNGGWLDIASNNALGIGDVIVNTGGVIHFWASSNLTINNTFILYGSSGFPEYPTLQHDGGTGLVTLNGDIILNGNSDIGVREWSNNDIVINGVIKGSGTLTIYEKQGATNQTIFFNSENTLTGSINIAGGTLVLNTLNALPTNINIHIDGKLELNGFSTKLGSISGNGIIDNLVNDTIILSIGYNNISTVYEGVIINTAGIINFEKYGTGTLDLNGNNTYKGYTFIDDGFINIGGSITND